MAGNLLYDGDNLDILRRHLDPPFNSEQDQGCPERPEKESMTVTARKLARHIIIMIVILVVTALAIWFDLGPAVQ